MDAGVTRAPSAPVKGSPAREPSAAASAKSAPPPQEVFREMEQIASEINRFLKNHRSVVDLSMDPELHQIITKVLNGDTGEVILQYPPEAVVSVLKRMRDLRGLLLHKEG
jgi:uncharacterized FlaG/YvyC family protein